MSLIPTGPKSEWLNQANAIAEGRLKVSEDDIPILLEWLKDMNWPGADIIAGFLVGYSSSLIEPIRDVLVSRDKIWVSWVLTTFQLEFGPEFWRQLIKELEAIGCDKDDENAHIVALSILVRYGISSNEIREFVEKIKRGKDINLEEYSELFDLLAVSNH